MSKIIQSYATSETSQSYNNLFRCKSRIECWKREAMQLYKIMMGAIEPSSRQGEHDPWHARAIGGIPGMAEPLIKDQMKKITMKVEILKKPNILDQEW